MTQGSVKASIARGLSISLRREKSNLISCGNGGVETLGYPHLHRLAREPPWAERTILLRCAMRSTASCTALSWFSLCPRVAMTQRRPRQHCSLTRHIRENKTRATCTQCSMLMQHASYEACRIHLCISLPESAATSRNGSMTE